MRRRRRGEIGGAAEQRADVCHALALRVRTVPTGMPIESRAYDGEADLHLMQKLQQELWLIEGPRTQTHVGDLAWGSTHAPRESEWTRRLWLDGGRCIAWAWVKRGTSVEYEVHPDHRGGPLHEELLHWFESEAPADANLSAWWMEGDDASLGLLARRGYTKADDGESSLLYHVRELDEPVAVPSLPDGFRLRTVNGEDDLYERVLVHQAVWAPSRVTEETYRDVMRTWPYRSDLDCVVEAPDASFASYVLCWYDDANRVGEFEPVGTHQNHRRRGFGAAVCRYALRRLQEEGAAQAIVYASGRPDQLQASALYESVGFRRHTRMLELRRTRA
jgi:ribosomal protein S18 acetylase RimI-like enzyme